MDATLIFYEAPHRIKKCLNDLGNILGNRKMSISREISKNYEEIYRGNVWEIIEQDNEYKGELVLVVEGNHDSFEYKNITIAEHIDLYIKEGMSAMDAIKKVAKDRDLKKSEVYDEYHNIEKK